MDDVTNAVQFEPGRWRVYVDRGRFRMAMVMSSLEFSKMLSGKPHKTDLILAEGELGPDEIDADPAILGG
jgi:hypothetical protein